MRCLTTSERRNYTSPSFAPSDLIASGFVTMDGRPMADRHAIAGMGYRLAAGGLGRRLPAPAKLDEPLCVEDKLVLQTARAWTRLTGAAPLLSRVALAACSKAASRVERIPLSTICQATAVCMVGAAGASTALYWQKSRTAGVDRAIGRAIDATIEAQAQTQRLRTEWLALNDPRRLQEEARRFSTLHPIAPTQFVEPAKLEERLTAPAAMVQAAAIVPAESIYPDLDPALNPALKTTVASNGPPAPAPSDASAPTSPAALAGTAAEREFAESVTAHRASAAEPRRVAAVSRPARDTIATQPQHLAAASPPRLPAASSPQNLAPQRFAAVAQLPRVRVRTVLATMRPIPLAPHTVIVAAARPHAPPHLLAARFDMPRWLTEPHAMRAPVPVLVMSQPPHNLMPPKDEPTPTPHAQHTGNSAPSSAHDEAAAPSTPDATEPDSKESEARDPDEARPVQADVPHHRSYSPYGRPAYRSYYGYGGPYSSPYGNGPYGNGPYGTSLPGRYYSGPNGYSSPYGPYGPDGAPPSGGVIYQ